jgi:membrane-bound lytic murein transglycosylase D
MAEILKANGVPPELLSVALVESKFINSHGRRGNPAGMWQMVPSTARRLGLRVDREVDERLDVVKSTGAAARYFHSLYERCNNSWPLVLAAYNAGEKRVERALEHQSASCDLKDISTIGSIPNHTREYVSKILAIILVARSHPL